MKKKESKNEQKEFLTIEEVAELLRLSRTTIWRYRRDGIIKTHRIGIKIFVARRDIESLFVG